MRATKKNDRNHSRVRPACSAWSALLLAVLLITSACGAADFGTDTSGGDDAAIDDAAAPVADAGFDEAEFEAAELAQSDDAAETSAFGVAAQEGDGQGAEDAAGPALATPASATPAELGRDLIFTARAEVLVDDLATATRAATAALEPFGGLLFGQESTTETTPRATLEFKVRPADFSDALEALAAVGDVQQQIVTTDDVTERLVDLGSQIASLEVSIARLQAFLADADSIDTVAALERELLDRENQLELLRGQQRTIQSRVDLASITLELTQRVLAPSLTITQTAYPGKDDGAGCPGRDRLNLDEPGEVTVCFVVVNNGDVTLADVEVVDESRTRDELEIQLLRGAPTLAPGDSAVFFAQTSLDRSNVFAASVRSMTADEEPVAARANEFFIDVKPSTDLPGFGDSLGTGVGALQAIGSILLVMIGVAIPFVLIAALMFFPARWIVRRIRAARPSPRTGSASNQPAPAEAGPPPPPPAAAG